MNGVFVAPHEGLEFYGKPGGGNSKIFYVNPEIGEDEPNLTHIFQMG